MNIENTIKQIEDSLPAFVPLQHFVAQNPTDTLSQLPFARVASEFADKLGVPFFLNQTIKTDNQLELVASQLKRICVYNPQLDIKKHIWQFCLSHSQQAPSSLWQAWLNENKHIKHTGPTIASARLEYCLQQIKLNGACVQAYCQKIIWQFKGWAGYYHWQQLPNVCVDLLCIWLTLEKWHWQRNDKHQRFQPHYPLATTKPAIDTALTALKQAEQQQQQQLLLTLRRAKRTQTNATPCAQMVFCIDTRSEPLRRHIEQQANIQTFGFAGFFGFIFYLNQNGYKQDQCPALIHPDKEIIKKIIPNKIQAQLTELTQAISHTQKSVFGSFLLYEVVGWLFAFSSLINNFLPLKKRNLKKDCHAKTELQAWGDNQSACEAAASLLKAINLTQDFAPLVVITGHHAETVNNPFQAALDCGACGGHSGYANAMVACLALNDTNIRTQLAAKNINIPDTTVFIPATHNTTTDEIDFFTDAVNLSPTQQTELIKLKQHCRQAGSQNRSQRRQSLPGDPNCFRRASHWAENIPEWGLANNYAFIIGPRSLTQETDLDGRVFLHDYDDASDPDGEILASIVAGPVVVAHWINMQYYFSTVAPQDFGAGDKTVHNIVPNVGVMTGNISDLRWGLAKQSVMTSEEILHQPLRLTVLVATTPEKLNNIINKNKKIKPLVDGEWLYIRSLDIA